jgi:hypothetical protein
MRSALALGVLTALLAVAQPPQQSDFGKHCADANCLPDKNAQAQSQDDKPQKQRFEAAETDRERQLAEDTSKLLELATQLKAEVDKTSKDTLSLQVIRKAESIEKLAKGVKEKMKVTAGAG